jgi:GWxTD domain-containing protein
MRFKRTTVPCPLAGCLCLWMAFLVLGGQSPLFSQRRGERAGGFEQSPIYKEAVCFVSEVPGKCRLDILYRIPQDFFVFIKNEDPESEGHFVGSAEISIEVLDSAKISVAQNLVQKKLVSEQFVRKGGPTEFLEGLFSTDVAPGIYSIILEVDDMESSRKYRSEPTPVRMKDYAKRAIQLSDAVFFQTSHAGSRDTLRPLNYGGDVPFGQNFEAYCEIASPFPVASLRAGYTLSRVMPEPDSLTPLVSDTLSPENLSGSPLLSVRRQDSGSTYQKCDTGRAGTHPLWLHFKGDTLTEGVYELAVRVSGEAQEGTGKKRFHIRWFDMPSSLRSLPFAVDALEYIATREELDRMRSADPRMQKKLFDEFWKKRDRTPGTAFNEVMAEYYRRVDHAFTTFPTRREPNGVKTDRGKTYVLYGPPATIRREMTPGTPTKELWTYLNLKKTIIFVDRSRSGEYELESTRDTP